MILCKDKLDGSPLDRRMVRLDSLEPVQALLCRLWFEKGHSLDAVDFSLWLYHEANKQPHILASRVAVYSSCPAAFDDLAEQLSEAKRGQGWPAFSTL